MRKIRVGNDFLVAWRIKRAGINEDLTNAVNMSVVASVKAEGQIHSVVVPFDIVDDSIIRVEMTPAIAQWEGIYNFVLKYEFEYPSYVDNNEKVAVDKNAFIIVSRTSQADEITLIDIESDVLIGLKGEKGDSAFTVWNKANGGDNTYQDWIDFLQSPANEIKADSESAIEDVNNAVTNINEVVIPNAEIATQEATDAKNDYYNVVRPDIQSKGEYAIEQGNYAKAQGDIVAGYTLITSIEGVQEFNEINII